MKTKLILSTFTAALAALTFTSPALFAADEKPAKAGAAGKLAAKDEKFVMDAAQGGMLEVRLGEVAKQKATRQDVKDFGSMMTMDHGKAGEELKGVAAKVGVTLPTDLDAKHKAKVDKLEKLSGADFDKEYVAEMVKDHEKDAKAFEDAANNAQNPDVKAFAGKTLPVIKTHLEKIKAMAGAEKK
ncbi:MAG: DUF4142 domain-containing protein [Chthoniobacteraceae bacterium]